MMEVPSNDHALRLGERVGAADNVIVVRGATYDSQHRAANEVLARDDDPASISSLVASLSARLSDAAVMTPGDPSLVFLQDREVLAVVTCIRPMFIRCPDLWTHDAELTRPNLLADWLRDHGV